MKCCCGKESCVNKLYFMGEYLYMEREVAGKTRTELSVVLDANGLVEC